MCNKKYQQEYVAVDFSQFFTVSFHCEYKCFSRIVVLFGEMLRTDLQAYWEKKCLITLPSLK